MFRLVWEQSQGASSQVREAKEPQGQDMKQSTSYLGKTDGPDGPIPRGSSKWDQEQKDFKA